MKKNNKLKFNSIDLKNPRFDKFLATKINHQKYLDTLNSSSRTSNFLQKSNLHKYKNVLDDIGGLFYDLEMIKTKSTFHRITVKDSLLNSHKNFIVINQYDKIKEGMPILQLKREDFESKTNLNNKVNLF